MLMTKIIANLYVDEERMLKNLDITHGRVMSEAVMIALTRKGMSRQEAHELLRRLSLKSEIENKAFKTVLFENETVRKFLSEEEIDEALKPESYLGTAIQQVERIVKMTKQEREARGLRD
jgi:adenylosuccinate lyase